VLIADASSNVRIHNYQRASVPPSYLPIGFVGDYAGTTAPSFWLLCYGQAVSRTTYSKLFDAIGETYGVGNGVTTFNLPDCRGRVVAGKDDMGGTSANRLTAQTGGLNGDTLGATGGAETHALLTAQMPTHTHSGTTDTQAANLDHSHTIGSWSTGFAAGVAVTGLTMGGSATSGGVNSTLNHTHTFTTGSAGSGSAHNNVQPTIIFQKMIFTGV
jgi:microcystin-dependent protein